MHRRTLLLVAGGSATSTGIVVGSGALSREVAGVRVEVSEDPDGYLGLEPCPRSPNRRYARLDGNGHLKIDLSPSNSIRKSKTKQTGLGINGNAVTYIHDVFRICNQGTEPVTAWIEVPERIPVQTKKDKGSVKPADEDRVAFYKGSQVDRRVDSESNALTLSIGECTCIGLSISTKLLSKEDSYLDVERIIVHARQIEETTKR
ncbi:DUF1102 domain-containing protein [Natrarchaeobius halalkaliphilus]|uniref:DUF1102 domain-containing protein n=1 Tax=Natrarchaeobius halalkaliphilus TaxID=1679091 RepID=A0A3N6LM48_9EURY|nr:DUF1102 domain-containing protein [Natrarchaeobius halalkaliphilus]RQG88827.1 DUF1102 domain-containing protein [Natrarchaeobius halalkaliphilus]